MTTKTNTDLQKADLANFYVTLHREAQRLKALMIEMGIYDDDQALPPKSDQGPGNDQSETTQSDPSPALQD